MINDPTFPMKYSFGFLFGQPGCVQIGHMELFWNRINAFLPIHQFDCHLIISDDNDEENANGDADDEDVEDDDEAEDEYGDLLCVTGAGATAARHGG